MQTLPLLITHGEQSEVLSLLCKVHELEIENIEMQSEGALPLMRDTASPLSVWVAISAVSGFFGCDEAT